MSTTVRQRRWRDWRVCECGCRGRDVEDTRRTAPRIPTTLFIAVCRERAHDELEDDRDEGEDVPKID